MMFEGKKKGGLEKSIWKRVEDLLHNEVKDRPIYRPRRRAGDLYGKRITR